MRPGGFPRTFGFAVASCAPLTLLTAAPALAQSFNASTLINAAPLAVSLGAGAFALLALVLIRRLVRDGRVQRREATEQIAGLRALVDEYEALLSGAREVTVVWNENSSSPKFLGQASAILPVGRRPQAVLDFVSWLNDADTNALIAALEGLRVRGESFDLTLRARDGKIIRATGWVLGGGAALRLRPAVNQQQTLPERAEPPTVNLDSLKAILGGVPMPAYLRNSNAQMLYTNEAYQDLARSRGTPGAPPEVLVRAGEHELKQVAIAGGKAGYLVPKVAPAPSELAEGLHHLGVIIDALATPIAIFNAGRELVQSNRAYAQLWGLDPNWLQPGLDERAILDKLRTDGMLPMEPDYQAWRARHLTSYQLTAPRESDPWHLPDGRTVQVIAAPAGPKGGVIYVFEDITDQLKLKSQHKTLIDVQRSTLNALSEGVAVFGTNGKLTLSNPRLSTLWKLPTNLLDSNPHIDQILEAVNRTLPRDGATIWRDLKRGIVDLNPTRTDTSGRIARADGRLLDYAITRLPDGQTMMTFVDVTESANYQRVLTERNEALITADRLKDAFVQNVSYELRSPLTNIIGFADLLSSETVGALNERQKAYTEYIRASSVTLGVLIDNILDLATVDAGIAEMRPEAQDVPTLVEKARAGLAATFPDVDGKKSLNIVVDIPPDLPPLVADGTRIVQILYNLMSSAARFSEPGGLVKLSVSAKSDRMIFTVEDNGAPMSEEMRAAILERADTQTISGRQRGAGLGLAIVRSFVDLHGGTIAVEPREPRGSRVIVSLPRFTAVAGAAE